MKGRMLGLGMVLFAGMTAKADDPFRNRSFTDIVTSVEESPTGRVADWVVASPVDGPRALTFKALPGGRFRMEEVNGLSVEAERLELILPAGAPAEGRRRVSVEGRPDSFVSLTIHPRGNEDRATHTGKTIVWGKGSRITVKGN